MAKKKKPKSKARPNSALQQAISLGNLQYGPQQRGLLAQLRDLRDTRDIEAGAAQGLAHSMLNLAEQQKAPINAAYDRSAQQVQDTSRLTSQATAGIRETPNAAALLASIPAETQRAQTRIGSERGAAIADVGKLQGQALASGQYGVTSATRRYRADQQKVNEELGGLFQDKGEFIKTQFSDLTKAQQAAALDRAGLRRQVRADREAARHNRAAEEQDLAALQETSRHNQASERNAARDKKNKRTPAYTRAQKRDARGKLRQAVRYLKDLGLKEGGEKAQDAIGFLNDKKGIDPLIGQAAAEIVLYPNQGLKKPTKQKLLNDFGIGGLK